MPKTDRDIEALVGIFKQLKKRKLKRIGTQAKISFFKGVFSQPSGEYSDVRYA